MSDLNLYLLTYNCGRTPIKPDVFASHFFDALPDQSAPARPPDVIVLHLQEIAPLAEGFQNHALERYYRRFGEAVQAAAKQRFPDTPSSGDDDDHGDRYVGLAQENAGITAIMLFVRADLQDSIKSIVSADVGVGMQRMGNKGAAGLRVAWQVSDGVPSDQKVMYLTFVSAHLAPMEEALDRRNQDFIDIASGLVFDSKSALLSKSSKQIRSEEDQDQDQEPLLSAESSEDDGMQPSSSKLIGIYAPDTHLFFAGDLNYRTSIIPPARDGSDIDRFPQPVSSLSNLQHFTHLLPHDQLTAQLLAGRTLHGLVEAPITFPPTYKYSAEACGNKNDIMLDSEVSNWKWSTHRWPSWCDRILYSPSPSSSSTSTTKPGAGAGAGAATSEITVGKYTALPLLATSDHRPVALSVSVPLQSVHNEALASHRPVALDPDWMANRESARFKESVVGAVLGATSSTTGVLSVTVGLVGVVCFAVLAMAYVREW